MIFDTTFTKLFSFDSNESSSRANLLVFILIVLFYAIGLYLILRYIKETINEDIRSKSNRFELLHKIVSMVALSPDWNYYGDSNTDGDKFKI